MPLIIDFRRDVLFSPDGRYIPFERRRLEKDEFDRDMELKFYDVTSQNIIKTGLVRRRTRFFIEWFDNTSFMYLDDVDERRSHRVSVFRFDISDMSSENLPFDNARFVVEKGGNKIYQLERNKVIVRDRSFDEIGSFDLSLPYDARRLAVLSDCNSKIGYTVLDRDVCAIVSTDGKLLYKIDRFPSSLWNENEGIQNNLWVKI
ncbi:hypothetical protein CHISP_0309 [Chitinispirillum alkaliphilum]|nr:hypothetical protein CHISP_0309 [Chitinispirillum alkaliphilum]